MENKLSLEQLIRFASFVDYEGTITIDKNRLWLPSISVSNSSEEAVRTFHNAFGGSFIQYSRGERRQNHFGCQIASKSELNFCLRSLKPYIKIKWRQLLLCQLITDTMKKHGGGVLSHLNDEEVVLRTRIGLIVQKLNPKGRYFDEAFSKSYDPYKDPNIGILLEHQDITGVMTPEETTETPPHL